VSKSLYNRADIIKKYQIVFSREKFFEFIVAIAKETSFSILVEKVPSFYSGTKEFSLFFGEIQITDKVDEVSLFS